MAGEFPKTWAYLKACEAELRGRERGRMDCDEWYGYVYPKNLDVFGTSRIIVRDIIQCGSFALDLHGEYAFVSGYGIILKNTYFDLLTYLLGLLNSRLLSDYLKSISTTLRGGWFRPFPQFMGQLPIKLPGTNAEKQWARAISERVMRIIEAKKDLGVSRLSDREREQLERDIEVHEKKVDGLVCDLYGVKEISV